MNTLLLVGGDLCERTAARLDPARWKCIGLRRRRIEPSMKGQIEWFQGDLANPESIAFLGDEQFAKISHVLYAPSPDGRTVTDYTNVYSLGLSRLLGKLSATCLSNLQRCVLVGSSAVWGPSDDWVDETTPTENTNFRATSLLDAEAALKASLPQGVGVALRLSGLYGPDRLRIIKGIQAGTIAAPEGPGHWANRIHIDDAAQACAHLLGMSEPEPVYIGTDDHPMPTAELYDSLARLMDAPMPTRRPQPPSGKRLSNARLRASGWTPKWPNALEWYTAHLK